MFIELDNYLNMASVFWVGPFRQTVRADQAILERRSMTADVYRIRRS
jgi:hypothetical protein